jgi:hypothetical protein
MELGTADSQINTSAGFTNRLDRLKPRGDINEAGITYSFLAPEFMPVCITQSFV